MANPRCSKDEMHTVEDETHPKPYRRINLACEKIFYIGEKEQQLLLQGMCNANSNNNDAEQKYDVAVYKSDIKALMYKEQSEC